MGDPITMAAAISALGGAAASVISKPDSPDKVKAPGDPNDPAKLASKQREMQRKYAGQGRAGTVLGQASRLG